MAQPKLGRSRHRTSSRRERALFDLFPQWAGYRFQHPPLACAGHRYSTQATQWYPSDRCPREKTTRLKGRLPRAQPRWLAGIWDLWPRCQHLPSGFRCLQIAEQFASVGVSRTHDDYYDTASGLCFDSEFWLQRGITICGQSITHTGAVRWSSNAYAWTNMRRQTPLYRLSIVYLGQFPPAMQIDVNLSLHADGRWKIVHWWRDLPFGRYHNHNFRCCRRWT